MLTKISKRDGRIERFEPEKISNAIGAAFRAMEIDAEKILPAITDKVISELNRKFSHHMPSVEQVQDIVEQTLMRVGYERTAKSYIEYRKKHSDIRDAKIALGVSSDELKLGLNAIKVLEARYLLKNEEGKVIETPSQLFGRVAREVARVEARYCKADAYEMQQKFYSMMSNMEFLPNSPTLMNAGTRIGQLSACFVLPVEDSIEGIFTTLKNMAIIHQSGGGTGFSFSRLRPKGDIVSSTKCNSSGPVSFIKSFDTVTDVIKQGGRRRGANIAVLRVDHPDIIEFITAKKEDDALSNFNISVAVTDSFMNAAQKKTHYELINPRTDSIAGKLDASDVLRTISTMAWNNGEPGLIFIDEINRHNPTPELGKIESTNPCGEQPLLPNESCNLGSINLSKFVAKGEIDWNRLSTITRLATRFLDDVIDANNFPLPEIEEMTKSNRKIGLGVMGFADTLIKLRVPYDSKVAVKLAEKIMRFIHDNAIEESIKLAHERGSFPNFFKSILAKKYKAIRNATLTTVAPTGTISIIAGCSSGIEPLFGISFVRNVMDGQELLESNKDFESVAKQKGFYSKELMMSIAQSGSVQHLRQVPKDVKRIFVTALEISPEWHIKIQAAFQKATDSAVSKTINFPSTASIADFEKAYKLAFKLKCKGITAYRYGSRESQVLSFEKENATKKRYLSVPLEFAGGCSKKECPF